MLLSRFCLKEEEEGKKFRSLEVRRKQITLKKAKLRKHLQFTVYVQIGNCKTYQYTGVIFTRIISVAI